MSNLQRKITNDDANMKLDIKFQEFDGKNIKKARKVKVKTFAQNAPVSI